MITHPVGRVYGDALYELAREAGEEERFREELGFVADLARRERDFRVLLEAPGIDRSEKRRVLCLLFDGRLDRRLVDFLSLLVDRGRQSALGEVRERFETRHDRDRRLLTVRVRSAVPLPEALARRLAESAGARTGCRVNLDPVLEEGLLGGLVVEYGDVQVDVSAARVLREVRREMLGRPIHAREVYEDPSR
ncbi:MAG: ATP synthase F1 subunit delta [Planctomycetes bacterium]|nr:ATP synthase F1 subunit delta [Planctomycetota bacterium]